MKPRGFKSGKPKKYVVRKQESCKIHYHEIKQVLKQYLGVELDVENRMLKWGNQETCQLYPGFEENLWNWMTQAGVLSKIGFKVFDDTITVTTPHDLL